MYKYKIVYVHNLLLFYLQFVNKSTIHQCYTNINEMGNNPKERKIRNGNKNSNQGVFLRRRKK